MYLACCTPALRPDSPLSRPVTSFLARAVQARQQEEQPLLGNLNLQMAREEYGANGQQGLDELLSVFADEGAQVACSGPHANPTLLPRCFVYCLQASL